MNSTCEKSFSFSAMKSAQHHQRQLHGKDTTDVSVNIGKRLGENSDVVKKSTKKSRSVTIEKSNREPEKIEE